MNLLDQATDVPGEKRAISEALKSDCFNVYMKVDMQSLAVHRVIGCRIKGGVLQVKTVCNRARRGYLWWSVTSVMQIYTQ